jgi:hypothetical protein
VRGLKDGWDGPGSIAIKKNIIELAENIVKDALQSARQPSAPYIVPGGDGSIQVEWHTKLGELELDLSPNGEAFVWCKNRISNDEFEAEDERALALFARWASWIAEKVDNEGNVPPSSNTSIYGSESRLPLYQDDTIA